MWIVLAAAAVTAGLWLWPGTEHDLSQPPRAVNARDSNNGGLPPQEAAAYPRLLSDDQPKKPILPPTEPFANGWSEPSPAAIVEQDAARAARETLERQSREMLGNN